MKNADPVQCVARAVQPPETAPCVTTYLLKKIYCAYLLKFPHAGIIEAWGRALDAAGRPRYRSLKELLSDVWAGNGHLPWEMLEVVLRRLERFALETGRDPLAFTGAEVFAPDGVVLISPVQALSRIDNILSSLFTGNLYRTLLEQIEDFNALLNPGTSHRIAHRSTNGEIETVFLVFVYRSEHHPSFEMMFANSMLHSVTSALGIPPFNEVEVLSEMRSIENIVDIYGDFVTADEVRRHARPVRFGAVLDEWGVPAPEPVRESAVARAQGDVFTRDGTARVLRKGRVYGAPFAVTRIRFPSKPHALIGLQKVINAAFGGPGDKERMLRTRVLHEELMDSLRDSYAMVFGRTRADLLVNSRKIASGVSARVIAAAVKEFARTGRTEFPNSFFRAAEGIVKSKIDKSLNLHLNRAAQRLRAKAPLLALDRDTGAGLVRLKAECEVTYAEQ